MNLHEKFSTCSIMLAFKKVLDFVIFRILDFMNDAYHVIRKT